MRFPGISASRGFNVEGLKVIQTLFGKKYGNPASSAAESHYTCCKPVYVRFVENSVESVENFPTLLMGQALAR